VLRLVAAASRTIVTSQEVFTLKKYLLLIKFILYTTSASAKTPPEAVCRASLTQCSKANAQIFAK